MNSIEKYRISDFEEMKKELNAIKKRLEEGILNIKDGVAKMLQYSCSKDVLIHEHEEIKIINTKHAEEIEILTAKQEVVELNDINHKEEIITPLIREKDEEFEQNCEKNKAKTEKWDIFIELPFIKIFGVNIGIKISVKYLLDKLKKFKPIILQMKSKFCEVVDKLKKGATCIKHRCHFLIQFLRTFPANLVLFWKASFGIFQSA